MSLSATTISAAIADLHIPGVVVKDLDGIPLGLSGVSLPILFPDPDNWGGETTTEMITFGPAAGRYWESTRTLGYLYFHNQVGAGRSPFDVFPAMSDNRDLIIEMLMELDIADVDVMAVNCGPFMVRGGAEGTPQFQGFTISLVVREKVNA